MFKNEPLPALKSHNGSCCSRMRPQTRSTRCLLGLSLVQYLVLNVSWRTLLGILYFVIFVKHADRQGLSLRIPFLCSALKI